MMKQVSSPRKVRIVGTGPAGASIARQCADAGCEVVVAEKRSVVGGHCYDEYDEHGVLVHRFGPHYFRTKDERLLDWLSRFTEWIPGRYYVRADVHGKLVPMPVSLSTMTALKGTGFTEAKFNEYLAAQREDIPDPQNAEEQCLALMGRELYELLFKGYTEKQWGVRVTDLAASVTARIPLRMNWDERYPVEPFQVMPAAGYTAMFEQMLRHPNIHVETSRNVTPDEVWRDREAFDATIYTGPVDELFDDRFGKLAYRSLRFEWKHYEAPFVQPCVQINYPLEHDYTRSVEIKHVTGQVCAGTTISLEYPESEGDPFYPLLVGESRERYAEYAELAGQARDGDHPVYLVGRLAEFRYYNMDQVFERALTLADDMLERWR